MTLLVDTFLGYEGAVFQDLLQIVRCDPGLTHWIYGVGLMQVGYKPRKPLVPSSNLLLALVNDPNTIIVYGVDDVCCFPGPGPITLYQALTILPKEFPPILIYVDMTDEAARGYVVKDTNLQTIYSPRQVALYHEFSHAYHFCQGDLPSTEQAAEVQGTYDENTFRAQLGLPRRHPTDHNGGPGVPSHGGMVFPSCTAVSGDPWAGVKEYFGCIVASAAMGSPSSARVEDLRRARREYRNFSLWATLISDPVLDLYRKFSPSVVRDMNTDPALRQAMLVYAVQPVCHLLQMAESYLRAEADDYKLIAALDRSVDEYLTFVPKEDVSALTLVEAAEGAAIAARALGVNRAEAEMHARRAELPGDLYGYLGSAIASKGSETVGYAWAFEGIDLFLGQAAARVAAQRGITPAFLEAFGTWLARLPIPTGALLSLADAPDELKVFAERIFTRPNLRAHFAQHLLAQWPAASVQEVRSLLSDLHYLQPNHDTKE